MQNTNRLIDDFKRQTMDTVWKHLDAMASNYAVYSTHLKGLSPFLTDYDVYLYCNDTNVVIMCLDCCGHGDRQTYKESESLSSIILEEGCEPRISVVWKLSEAVCHIKNCLQSAQAGTEPKFPINVYGVLLTEADILNAHELYSLWDDHSVTVIDCLNRLKYRRIRVSNIENDDLACKEYVKTIMDAGLETPTHPEKASADPCEEVDDTCDFLLDDLLFEDDESPEEDAPEEDAPEEESFPCGVIEQNQSVSVKVEILRPIDNPREELDKLVGCSDIKRRMDELVSLSTYNKMMHKLFPEVKQHEVSLHSIFLGSPGTGKTTVCKIFGSLLRQAGALSKGHIVICDRGTFIGTLWGDEERSIRQVLEMAKGGVLMIDEAYLLNGKHEGDPGKLVLQLLMNILADETQRDIAIVLCGYKEPMRKLLNTNPGLQSRFPNKFEFADFTINELLEITRRRIKEYDYKFSIQAWDKYKDMLTQAYQMRDPETWGNGRFIANQLERIYIQHADRCVKQQPKDKNELLLISPEDIVPIEIPRQKVKIGF